MNKNVALCFIPWYDKGVKNTMKRGKQVKAIIFVRSREEEKRAQQAAKCEAYAAENGIEVMGIYEGDKQMFKRAAMDDIDFVIVPERSRLTRDAMVFCIMAMFFETLDVKLICVNEMEKKR